MTNSKHIPKRRFKEFESNGEWEETKLRELFQYIGNAFVGTATPYYVESGHFYLESNNIKDGQINYNTEVFINDEFYQKQKNKWLQTGDMVMVQSGHVGHAAVIPENLNNSAAHALIMFRNPSENLESHFLNYQYQTTKAKEKIKTITTGNTIQHILASDMKEYKVYISNIKEQLKIGKFFQTIDSLITLHQHKLDKLKNLKKAYLSEMFPAEGERVPKRRFPGFEGKWEEIKLRELFQYIGNAFVGTATPYYVESGHLYLESNNIKDGQINYNTEVFINDEFYQKQKNKWLQTGDMVMVQSGHVGHAAVIPENLNNSAAHALIIFRNPSENLESHFLNYQYQTTKAKEKIKTITTGNTIQHILASDMKEYKVYISNIKEQKKIGNFFLTIDSLITLQQQKLDKLNDLKKAYLNELFV